MADFEKLKLEARRLMRLSPGGGSIYTEIRLAQEMILGLELFVVDSIAEIQGTLTENQVAALIEIQTILVQIGAIQTALAQFGDEQANIKQILAEEAESIEMLKNILVAIDPPEIGSVEFGWGGSLTTYPINNHNEVQMSDVSFTDNSTGDTATLVVLDINSVAFTPTPAPTWVPDSAGAALFTLTVAADGMSATAVPAVPPTAGSSVVTITVVNADGTPPVVLTSTVTVTAPVEDAASATVTWTPIVPVTAAPAS